MPRLPVSQSNKKPESHASAAPLTVKVSGAAFTVFVAAALLWYLGLGWLNEWLQIGTSCSGETLYSRKARITEGITCVLAAGPGGWLLLGWAVSLPLFTMFWLERALRRLVKERGRKAGGE